MLFLKRGLMAAGALALAAMLLNFVAPRAAHALVATAVQVMNTPATPIPNKDVDAPARSPLTLSCGGTGQCTTSAIPAGYTFVLDSYAISAVATVPSVGFLHWTPPGTGVFGEQLAVALTSVSDRAVAGGNFTMYAAGGTAPYVFVEPPGAPMYGVFTGHLVSTP
jgi:hypothetical protein